MVCLFLCGCAAKSVPLDIDNRDLLVGSWEGYWDGQWHVKFDIKYEGRNKYKVLYQWQERVDGPYLSHVSTYRSVSPISIRSVKIEIKIEKIGDYGAIAIGDFPVKRSVRLRRMAETLKKDIDPRKACEKDCFYYPSCCSCFLS